MAEEKNALVSQTENQEDPYHAKASDFPAPKGRGAYGEAEGRNELAAQSEKQCGPRHAEDDGDNTPSVWGKGGKEFKVGQASEGGSSVSIPESVDLESGHVQVKGYSPTRVKETPGKDVRIPSKR